MAACQQIMNRRTRNVVVCGAVAIAAWAALVAAPAGDHDAAAPQDARYRVWIDPDTGAPGPALAGASAVDTLAPEASSMPTDGLREELVPLPGGGVVVDLRGRFRHAFVATADEDGNVGSSCTSQPRGEP